MVLPPESVTLVSCFINPFRQGRIHDRSTPPQQARAVRVKPQLRMRTGTVPAATSFWHSQAAWPMPALRQVGSTLAQPFAERASGTHGSRTVSPAPADVYLRIPTFRMTVLYRSVSYFFR